MTATSYRSNDVDEANAVYNRLYYESRIDPARSATRPFDLNLKVDTIGPLTYSLITHGCETTTWIGGLDMTYTVGVPLSGTFPMQFGPVELIVDPFTAVLSAPTSTLKFKGYRTRTDQMFSIVFDRDSVETQLGRLLGRDRIGTINLAPRLDLRNGHGRQWWRLASGLALDLKTPTGLVTNPMMTADLSGAIITGLLLAADHPYREVLDSWGRPTTPAAIRRAMSIIESRAHEPLTVPEVAAAIGCSATALQAGYRKYLGMTPREHIGRVRMDGAHSGLQSADPESTTVAAVAARWGFRHPGRFAAAYRKVYGVSPNVTLRGR